MTPEKKAEKNRIRRQRNEAEKLRRAREQRAEMIELGKTVIVTENEDGTKNYAFPPPRPEMPSIPRLAWLGGKSRRHGISRKTRPGLKPEHTAALIEDASRSFTKEVDKALGVVPPSTEPSVPMVSPAEGL